LVGVHTLIALHITHYLIAGRTLSPVEPSESMYTLELGYVNCGFIFFAVALAGTMIFGRFFCGWGCHIVALQDACGWIMKKLGVRPKPFRSRLLAFAPLALAFYMFGLPTLMRLVSRGEDGAFPGFSNHLMTSNLWATFPGPVFGILTFATCGFAAVYFLGAKGFCTYGCPYGALFGGLDYAAPGRIVVNDDCEQCGHCTATCTSNVRVHEEVRLYGMVVDPGCMKCMDCVSVCPKGALRYSFAAPSFFKKAPATPRKRLFDLRLREELLVGAVAVIGTLTFRDLYNGPPLLMSVGLGGITAFLSLKLWQLVRQPGVRVQNLELKTAGRIRRPGWVFASLSVLWLLFTSESAFAQWHRVWGRHYLNQTEISRADGLSGAYRAKTYTDRHERAAAEAFRHFSLADRWGLAGVVEVKLGLAWCYVLRGDFGEATHLAQAASAIAPDQSELKQNVVDIERAAKPSAADRFALAELFASSGRLEDAAREFEACLVTAPDSAPARFDLGTVLRRLGRNDAAIEQLEIAQRLSPEDVDVEVELGLAYLAAGDRVRALTAFNRAMVLDPDNPEAKLHLPELIGQAEGK
jgi:polyferredoxin/tetratricopeptide (TPR) repeat protein